MHKYSILVNCNLTPIQRIKTDMLQLKTILKVLYPADVVLLFLKTSFLLHSMMLRGSSFQFLIQWNPVNRILLVQRKIITLTGLFQ